MPLRAPSASPRIVLVASAVLAMTASAGHSQEASIDFVRDVRPVLQAKCYACHGPEKQKSGLRLDEKAAAMQGGDSGPAIVPGKAADSDLIRRVTSDEADVKMPPKGDRLTASEIAKLRGWIDEGAKWTDLEASSNAARGRDHWAFKAPVRPAEPPVKDASWCRNPIDRFLLAHLEQEGLKPSPEADRATLLRRLSLDLIGLPPSIAEIDGFLNDPAPDAYEKQVDRLLRSPHHGERWGGHWLDAARYADSDGFEKDKPRYIWFYRDWVIQAINRDLPYNQFLIEQLAGDLLPDATQDQVVATGFLRNSLINEEGGVDPEQFRMEAMFDRMDAIGKSMLGLTIQCAQCHNHKYDPTTQEDYYRFFAFLNNDDEPSAIVYSPDEQRQIAEIHRKAREIEDGLRHSHADWPALMAKWEESSKANRPTWTTIQSPFEEISTGGQKYRMMDDGSYLACGYAPTKHTANVTIKTDAKTVSAIRLELLNDANLPGFGPGRSFKGTCALSEISVEVAPADAPDKKQTIKLVKASSDFDQPEAPLEPNFDDRSGKKRVTGPSSYAIDGNGDTAWGIDAGPGRRNVPRNAVFVFEKPVTFEKGAVLTVHLSQNHGGWNSDDLMTNNLGRFRLSVTDAPEAKADNLPARVRDLLEIPAEKRSPAQVAAIFSEFRKGVPEWKAENEAIEALWKSHPAGTTTLVLHAREKPRMTSLLKRGDFLKPVRPVTAGTPGYLHPMPSDSDGSRLALARWIVAPESPTTARVFVNRTWQTYFGTGIVATPEDFGLRAEPPSHPQLLDWLAVEFMARGWSPKALHKMIVTSASYRQSSKVSPEMHARDPYNRLLARGPRLRVEAEIVRDIQLSASGLLNEAIGGKSIMPPAPAFLFQPPASYAPFPWKDETGPDRYRRGIYVWRRRSTPFPLLNTFDAPEGVSSCIRRTRSNTPLQALLTLNEATSMEAARALGRRILDQGGDSDADRLAFAFRLCTGRVPTAPEREILQNLLDKEARRFADGWANPWEVATGSKDRPQNLPKNATPTQLATYTLVGRVLLNLDETITKE